MTFENARDQWFEIVRFVLLNPQGTADESWMTRKRGRWQLDDSYGPAACRRRVRKVHGENNEIRSTLMPAALSPF